MKCSLEVHENVDELYQVFLSEKLESDRASCTIKKDTTLVFEVKAKDPVSMRAFLNTILKIIETYDKIKAVK
jgi:tRNA threonylcarbamoyladenosine modification (KEOPS) complex  Pcc1 subunit